MRNLIINQTITSFLTEEPVFYWVEEFSKRIVIVNENFEIQVFEFKDNFDEIESTVLIDISDKIEDKLLLEELKRTKFIVFKAEDELISFFTLNCMVIDVYFDGSVKSNKLLEGTKFVAGKLSPNLEIIALVTADFTVHLLDYSYNVLDYCPLDDDDMSDSKADGTCKEATVTWRGDSQFFAILFSINGGRKCIVRDAKLNLVKGPARADNVVVFSMAESPVQRLLLIRYK